MRGVLSKSSITQHSALDRALARHGRITFARYMELALYDRLWGYYSRRARLGADGDFYTSPELHPMFAGAIAARAETLWRTLGSPHAFDLIEVGGGSGRLARDLLMYVREVYPEFFGALRFRIDERSAGLREQQLQRLNQAELSDRVHWTSGAAADWPVGSVHGLIVANELLDAFPVHLVTGREGVLQELFVIGQGGRLVMEAGSPSTPRLTRYIDRLGVTVPNGAQWEVNLAAPVWLRRVSRAVRRGGLLLMDYGYEAAELYNGSRPQGTLLCYARHALGSNPLERPGTQDITAHVDFTTIRQVLKAAGLWSVEYRTQRAALVHERPAWRDWTQDAPLAWSERVGRIRSLESLVEPAGLGALRWLLSLRGADSTCWPETVAVPLPSSPTLAEDHLNLADPAALDPLPDIEEQWREMWSEDD
ncbi:MAG: class I SAM-dependent methyltransferase [Chloroflexota bacterium]